MIKFQNFKQMKKILIISTLICLQFSLFANEEMKLSGIYQGENLFVMNPFSVTGVGFCIYEVRVNGNITTDEIHSSAFEIDLSLYGFDIGNKIEIVIKHKSHCLPMVINPSVINPKCTFKIESIKLDKSGKLSWSTTNESGELPYIIEQYKWNKWVRVTSVLGKGTQNLNYYSCKVNYTTGENKFRVKQKDDTKKVKYSQEVTYRNLSAPVTFTPGNARKTRDYIVFSAVTNYEIYDYYGKIKLRNRKDKVQVSSLEKGTYFINYDNKTETFIKK